MHTTLYLTETERSLVDSLPDALRAGWEISLETNDTYESVRQIQMRYQMADLRTAPTLEIVAERLKQGDELSHIVESLNLMDAASADELFFAMGARGVRSLIETLLPHVRTDEDIELLSLLTTARHKLLEVNAAATHS